MREKKLSDIAILFIGILGFFPNLFAQPYYPAMIYDPPKTIAPGVKWIKAYHNSPAWKIHIIEVDLSNANIDLVPVFKSGTSLEKTSVMGPKVDGIAAVNGGFFQTVSPYSSNSYTRIDGNTIAPNSGSTPRSVFGLWGNHNSKLIQTKISSSTPNPANPDWNKVINSIGGRGSFFSSNSVVTLVDTESTATSHFNVRNPRTTIGFNSTTNKVYLVTVDGRQSGYSEGMTYDEVAQLMADLGIEISVSLDGGGSTTCWIKGSVVNSPSDGPGTERSVVSAWVVVPQVVIDNTDIEATVSGTWVSSSATGFYNLDVLTTSGGSGANQILYQPDLWSTGTYKVFAWWTQNTTHATNVPYIINHRYGTDTVTVNQQTTGRQWNLLGIYEFEEGTTGSVLLSDNVTTEFSVSGDAVKFVRINRLILKWSKPVGSFPWFQNDSLTRGFALNPKTGNVIVTSYTSGGGVFALANADGSQVQQLGGSGALVGSLSFTGAAVTRTGKIFVPNLVTSAGTNNHNVYYWSSETTAVPVTLIGSAPGRMGDSIDAYEDPQGNITVIVAGNQSTGNPMYLLKWYYNYSLGTWTQSVVTTSGSPVSGLRLVTIKQEGGTSYEIWLKNLTGSHYRFNSNGTYLGTAWAPGTVVNSNYYFATESNDTVQYMATGPYSSTGDVILYDATIGQSLETAPITHSNANSNASGRMAVTGYNGELFVLSGITNNTINLYGSSEPPLTLNTPIGNWSLYY